MIALSELCLSLMIACLQPLFEIIILIIILIVLEFFTVYDHFHDVDPETKNFCKKTLDYSTKGYSCKKVFFPKYFYVINLQHFESKKIKVIKD